MLNLRLKQARSALTDGLLDEAYRLVQEPAVREHRDGQRLIADLVNAYTQRAQKHLNANLLDAADADLQRAQWLGGPQNLTAELRSQLDQRRAEKHNQQHHHRNRFRLARHAANIGQHSQGLRILNQNDSPSPSTHALAEEIQMNQNAAQQTIKDIEEALKRSDLDHAIQLLAEQKQTSPRLTQLRRKLVQHSTEQLRNHITLGQLPRAYGLYNALTRITPHTTDLNELTYHLNDCREAWRLTDAQRYREATQHLHRIAPHYPKARWIDDTIKQLTAAAEHAESIHQSPLGQLCYIMDHPAANEPGIGRTASSPSEWRANKPVAQPIDMQPPPLPNTTQTNTILRVDGIGSYLISTNPTTTVGPISSKQRPLVGLVADPTLPVFAIERHDDDYFTSAPTPIRVNDQPATQHLLRDGDRLSLTARCRMKFARPNAASATAVLQISGTRLPQGDIRHVILLDRELLLANHAGAHIKNASIKTPLTLIASNDQLTANTDTHLDDGTPIPAGSPLPTDRTLNASNLRFTLTRSEHHG